MSTPSHYIPSLEMDQRHRPGPEAQPYWNESFWFPMYDARNDIGIVFRSGIYPAWNTPSNTSNTSNTSNNGSANCFLSIIHEGRIVLALSDQRAKLPPDEPARIVTDGGLTIEWEEPLQSFRLRFAYGSHAFDLRWKGMSPPFLYQGMEAYPIDVVPRHIEQGGRAVGMVQIGGKQYAFDGHAHRDHTFGGERDWDKFYRWNYLSGEFDESFWFNAVRIKFNADMDWLSLGCLWDGSRLMNLSAVDIAVRTSDGGTRPVAAEATLTDEEGRVHRIVTGRFCGVSPVLIWNAWLKDYLVEYKMGDRIGYGVLEHGYREGEPLAEFMP